MIGVSDNGNPIIRMILLFISFTDLQWWLKWSKLSTVVCYDPLITTIVMLLTMLALFEWFLYGASAQYGYQCLNILNKKQNIYD